MRITWWQWLLGASTVSAACHLTQPSDNAVAVAPIERKLDPSLAEQKRHASPWSASTNPEAGTRPALVPSQASENVDAPNPERAMNSFLAALRAKDVSSLLRCFSKRRPFALTMTGQGRPRSSTVSYEALALGLQPGGDYASVMFGDDELDSIRDYAVPPSGRRPWIELSALTFVPRDHLPSHGQQARVWVSWRLEGHNYVVHEVAAPF